MFQTDINLYLQSFSSGWLDALMLLVSWTGGQTFLVGILCLVALGIDIKRGFLLAQLFLVTIVATDILKTTFALPQPFYVDYSLKDFGALKDGVVAFSNAGAASFLSLIPDHAVSAYRGLDLGASEFGLPSGHTTGAVALWAGLAVVFRKNALVLLAFVMIPLMMLSRLYLARHFLADVLVGFGLSISILIVFSTYYYRTNWQRIFILTSYSFANFRQTAWLFLVGFGFPVALIFIGEGHVGRIASLLAVNLALIILVATEISFEEGNFWQRGLRVVLGFVLFFALNSAVKLIPIPHDAVPYQLLKGFVPVFTMLLAAPILVSFTIKERMVNFNRS
ncbi:MAG: phosphatase PAP2 family protein [Sneathiella sp.]